MTNEHPVSDQESFIKKAWSTLIAHYKNAQPDAKPLSTQDLLEQFKLATECYLPRHQRPVDEPYLLDSRLPAKAEILAELNNHILELQNKNRHNLINTIVNPMDILQKRMDDPHINKQKAMLLNAFLQGSATDLELKQENVTANI